MALQLSALFSLQSIEDQRLLLGYWVAGDEAYVCPQKVWTPCRSRRCGKFKDCINYWLLSAFVMIYQTFGALIGRWVILCRPLRVSVDIATQVALVCLKLHNYIIDEMESTIVPAKNEEDLVGVTMGIWLLKTNLCALKQAVETYNAHLFGRASQI